MSAQVLTVLGVDPGPTTGIALLTFMVDGWVPLGPDVVQCNAGIAVAVVRSLTIEPPTALAVERFVVGPRAARSSTPVAGQITRELIGLLAGVPAAQHVQRSAAEVKPWATDRRLDAAGLLAPTKGMPHARDACRHALFSAVRDCGLPDPLSKRSTPCSPTGV